MRSRKAVWFALGWTAAALCSSAASISITNVAVVTPSDPAAVPKYSKLELRVTLANTTAASFYIPEPAYGGLDLSAVFTAPDSTVFNVNGFFDGGQWRIRFAPTQIGGWGYQITAKDPSGAATFTGGAFTCTNSASPGFVQINGSSLQFTEGPAFVGVGHNNGWQDSVELPSFGQMAVQGENLLTFWMMEPWIKPNDPTRNFRTPIENAIGGLSNYDQNTCAYLDGVVSRAENAGVYLLPCIWPHDSLWGTASWTNNAYSISTACPTPQDFFNTAIDQFRLQKYYYRYLLARWGYSTAIIGWIGVVEIDLTNGGRFTPATADAWVGTVGGYFASLDAYRTHSLLQYPMAITQYDPMTPSAPSYDPGLGMRSCDSYSSQTDDVGIATTIANQTTTMRNNGKPAFHNEFGAVIPSAATQPKHIHNGTWAAIAQGAASTPLCWCDGGQYPLMTDATYGAPMLTQLHNLSQFVSALGYAGNPALARSSIATTINGWGMNLPDRGYAWFQNTSGTIGAQAMSVSGLTNGAYTVQWFDGWTSGTTSIRTDSIVVAGGTLNDTLPVLAQADIACTYSLNSAPVTPVIGSAGIAIGAFGTPFGYQIRASNRPTSYSCTPPAAIPAGLSFNTSSGLLSGTPTATGTVILTIGAANGAGPATKSLTLTINKASATVALSGLAAVYDGTPKSATATTTPNGLSVVFTYNGSLSAPINAGSYAVVGTISDANYNGTATGTLAIAKAAPVVTWNNPADISYPAALSGTQLNAATGVAGTFVYTPPAGTVLQTGSGQVLSVVFSPTDTVNYVPARATMKINVTSTPPPQPPPPPPPAPLPQSPAPPPPVLTITSTPTANSALAVVGQPIQIFAAASSSGPLTWTWNFGDGASSTGDSTATHTFMTPGNYTVTVSVTNSGGQQASSTLLLSVNPAGAGTAGTPIVQGSFGAPLFYSLSGLLPGPLTLPEPDFFPPAGVALVDGTLSGTPLESGDFPIAIGGAGGVEMFVLVSIDPEAGQSVFGSCAGNTLTTLTNGFVRTARIKLNFAKSGRDSIALSGKLSVPDDFTPAGKIVELSIGGVAVCIKLDAKGNGSLLSGKSKSSFKLKVKSTRKKVKAQSAPFVLQLSNGSFAARLAQVSGLLNADVPPTSKRLKVLAIFNQAIYSDNVGLLYSARRNKVGNGKK